jgi:hypothetical protein
MVEEAHFDDISWWSVVSGSRMMTGQYQAHLLDQPYSQHPRSVHLVFCNEEQPGFNHSPAS